MADRLLTSTASAIDVEHQSAYAASKAALIKFTQNIQTEVGRQGVKMFAVHPGTVDTQMGKRDGGVNIDVLGSSPEMQKMVDDFQDCTYRSPQYVLGDERFLKKLGTTLTLAAHTMVWLAASSEAKLLNGRMIDSQYDLQPVVDDLKKDENSMARQKGLYRLSVHEL
ncbi:MAG: hypothetical protein Q9159_002887 [Coniocarpon cinnabarinum]